MMPEREQARRTERLLKVLWAAGYTALLGTFVWRGLFDPVYLRFGALGWLLWLGVAYWAGLTFSAWLDLFRSVRVSREPTE